MPTRRRGPDPSPPFLRSSARHGGRSAHPDLVLGPLVRHVGSDDATIWVETSRPCTVEVSAGSATFAEPTFQVAGHHYALVIVEGLASGASVPYEVRLDGRRAWPPVDHPYPPSVIPTIDPEGTFRLAFGSCRSPSAVPVEDPGGSGEDVLAAYARTLAARRAERPAALLLLGDQVYADETSEEIVARIRARRDTRRAPGRQVADFEEYTWLYREAWSDPDVRWLLSTVPTSMIFDDHDVIDDWNTSRSWRAEMARRRWWDARITGALMAYWIYQHLGNLSPAALRSDALYREVREAADGRDLLRAFARSADREADGGPGTMWSYRRDFGRVRLLVIDSRAGRVLNAGDRSMIGETEFRWIEAQVEDGTYDHLLIGSSVPWLLPRALHDIEALDEALCSGSRGRLLAWLGERLRRAVDLEHWAAFRDSFERLTAVIGRVARGETGAAPATVCVLSGDVHHTYASEARYREGATARVFQLTCSPLHNTIPLPMRAVFSASWSRAAERVARRLGRAFRVPAPSIEWTTSAGPFFGNNLAMVELTRRSAVFSLQRSVFEGPLALTRPVPGALRPLGTVADALGADGPEPSHPRPLVS